jgi:hypothetical protein
LTISGTEGRDTNDPGAIELARHETESSSAHIEPVRAGQQNGIAVVFTGTHDLHYYANPQTATAPGFELKVAAKSDHFDFGAAVFPGWEIVTDPFGAKVEVYAGDFTVFVPITAAGEQATAGQSDVEVLITGQACTSKICLLPFENTLHARIDWSRRDSWKQIAVKSLLQPMAIRRLLSRRSPSQAIRLGLP